ncbi:hypothetical protein EV426DRAFT_105840 [Tirmania nivea]|nr:hypothetical protein EV426DRAFT_105840 [Tirmania nivea]
MRGNPASCVSVSVFCMLEFQFCGVGFNNFLLPRPWACSLRRDLLHETSKNPCHFAREPLESRFWLRFLVLFLPGIGLRSTSRGWLHHPSSSNIPSSLVPALRSYYQFPACVVLCSCTLISVLAVRFLALHATGQVRSLPNRPVC